MRVSILSIVFIFISVVVQTGTPIFLFLYFRKKFDAKVIPMIFGVFGFVIFALVLEGSINMAVINKFSLREKPAVYIIYGIFMAGIFEETARFAAFNALKKKYGGTGTALAYGIGHGGVESVLLAGITMLIAAIAGIIINTGNIEMITGKFQGNELAAINNQINALVSSPSYMFLISGLERLMAIVIQLSLSVIVFHSVYNQQPRPKGTGYVVLIRYLYSGFNTFFNRPKARTRKRAEGIKPLNTNQQLYLFPLAILIHAIIDFPAAAFQAGLLKNVLLVEGIVFIFAIAAALFAKYIHDREKTA